MSGRSDRVAGRKMGSGIPGLGFSGGRIIDGRLSCRVLYASIWLALVLLVVAEAGKGPLAARGTPARWARPAWIAGALLAIVHALVAFAVRYGWDHERAVVETANQAAGLY